MKTSENGIELIKKFEGFRATPYKDIAGYAILAQVIKSK